MNDLLVIAQISDSHLFADIEALHCGVNVYQNFVAVLNDIAQNKSIDYVIFTGDLTQDHSEESYQVFTKAVVDCNISIPVYFLSGNHDEPQLLTQYLSVPPFSPARLIETSQWQIVLLESKSSEYGPAGHVDDSNICWLKSIIDINKSQLLFMHHHPINVGYFIDQHGLKDANDFWQAIVKFPSIKAIGCGHVHNALTLSAKDIKVDSDVLLYTCPATSIQFDPLATGVSALNKGPGYRLFSLAAHGVIHTQLKYLPLMDKLAIQAGHSPVERSSNSDLHK